MNKTRHEIEVEDHARRGVMLVFVTAHFGFVFLWAINRLNLPSPSSDPLLHLVVTSSLWVALNLIGGIVVLAAAVVQRREAAALAYSFSVGGAYSVLRFLWALTAPGNEPLVGGFLGILMALGAYGLCMSYAAQPPPRE